MWAIARALGEQAGAASGGSSVFSTCPSASCSSCSCLPLPALQMGIIKKVLEEDRFGRGGAGGGGGGYGGGGGGG